MISHGSPIASSVGCLEVNGRLDIGANRETTFLPAALLITNTKEATRPRRELRRLPTTRGASARHWRVPLAGLRRLSAFRNPQGDPGHGRSSRACSGGDGSKDGDLGQAADLFRVP